jgi:hypothetical protein
MFGRTIAIEGGQVLPIGYAAISFVPRRRRRGPVWLRIGAVTLVFAIGLTIWWMR